MKKFYSFIAFAVMMVVSFGAKAQTMPEENPVLNQMGYRIEKNVDFVTGTVNGKEISPNHSLVAGDKESFKINSNDVTRVANEGLEFMSIQLWGNGIDWPEGKGLRTTKNERWIVVNNLREGQILAVELTNQDTIQFVVNSAACNAGTGWADTPVETPIVEPISGTIHELQELAEEGSADTFRYFKVVNAGSMYAKFNGKSSQELRQLQIWSSKEEEETVEAPIYKIVGVDRSARTIELKTGGSTFGNACTITYGIMETEDATVEDFEYNADEKFVVSSSEDEDGDGIVVIEAVAVSESGVKSEVVRFEIPVGEVMLNSPSLSLMTVKGIERSYKIGWTRNTVNLDEPVTITVQGSGEDDGLYAVWENNEGIGQSFVMKDHATVTISAQGYADAVVELDANAKGKELSRKNTATDAEGNTVHDWDFVNITQEMSDMYTGAIPGSYIVTQTDGEKVDTIATYTVEEYEAAEQAGEDVSNWQAVPKSFGWWTFDGNNKRTTLNVVEGGNDRNANGFGYVEDETGIFHDLAIACAPNPSNNSCIFKYVGKEDGNELGSLGVYFMARPTITIPRTVAKAGEFVEVYYGQGYSNATTTTTHEFYEVPQDGFLSITLPGNGVHVFYIDVYTHNELPEDLLENPEEAWKDVVAIEDVKTPATAAAYYTVSGAKIAAPQKGINIVKYADGTSMKIMVK